MYVTGVGWDCGKTFDALQSRVLETGVKKRLQCTSCESVGNHQADEVVFCALERGLACLVVGNPRHQTARMHSRHENHAWWQALFPVTHERISFKYRNIVAEFGTKKTAPKDGFDEIFKRDLLFLNFVDVPLTCLLTSATSFSCRNAATSNSSSVIIESAA